MPPRRRLTHGHAADDVTSGTFAVDRLGSGATGDLATKFLRADRTWATPSSGTTLPTEPRIVGSMVAPGVSLNSGSPNTVARFANTIYFEPCRLLQSRTFSGIAFRVSTAATLAGQLGYVTIYACGDAFAVGSRLYTAGSASISSTGAKTVTLGGGSFTLAAGNYLLAYNSGQNHNLVTYYSYDLTGMSSGLSNSYLRYTVAQSSSPDPLPTSPSAPSWDTTGTVGFEHTLFLVAA